MRNYPEESEQRWYSDRYPGERDDRYDGFNAPDPQYEETRSWGGDPAPPAEDPGPYRTQPIERGPRYRQPAGPAVAPMAPPSVGTPPPPPPPAPPVSPGPGAPGPVPGYVAPPSAPPPNIPPPSVPQVPEQAGGAVYRTKRAGVAVLIGAVAAVSELLILAKVLVAAFGSKGTPGTTLAALLALNFPEAKGAEAEVLMYAALVLLAITLAVNVIGTAIVTRASRQHRSAR